MKTNPIANARLRLTPSLQGFTLIEALITVIVLGVGLLGVAWLQFYSLRFNAAAHDLTIATTLASDMLDRIRANPQATAAPPAASPDASRMLYFHDISNWEASAGKDCGTVACTWQELAAYDVAMFQSNVAAQLGVDVDPDLAVDDFKGAVGLVCRDNKPDELTTGEAIDEERTAYDCAQPPETRALDTGKISCDPNGVAYVVKIWWCDRETKMRNNDVSPLRYLATSYMITN